LQTTWENYVTSHFSKAIAVGINTSSTGTSGGTGSATDADLQAVAFTPGGSDEIYQVADLANLTSTLVGTVVPSSQGGNVLFDASGSVATGLISGADGWATPQLVSVTYGTGTGAIHSFVNNTTPVVIQTNAGTLSIFNDGHYTFTAKSNVTVGATDSIKYTVQDADGSQVTSTLNLVLNNLNDAPSGANATFTINEDASKTFAAADFGFSDVNGDALAAVKITTLPTAGTLTNNGMAVMAGQVVSSADIAAGHLVFTPAANANGTAYANFSFQVQDNGGTANGGINLDASPNTISLNVTPVNDAPVAGMTNSTYAATEQISLYLQGTGLSIRDIDAGSSSMTVSLSVGEGILTVSLGNSGAAVSGSGTSSLTITGTATQINNLLGGVDTGTGSAGTIVFNDNTNTPSTSTLLTMQVNDNGNTGGGALTAVHTALINFNHAPVAVDDSVITNSGASVIVPEWALLLNDTDVDTAALDISGIVSTSSLSGANLTSNPGAVTVTDSNPSSAGRFDYTVTDGTATDTGSVTMAQDTVGALDGTAGNDILIDGLSGAHTLNGGGGNDVLIANNSGDTLNGGTGNDVLMGGTGSDVFQWSFADQGTTATPSADVIKNFSLGTGGDVLNLKDLLVGEHDGSAPGTASNLANFLHFGSDATGHAVLSIDHVGGTTFHADQTITMENVSFTSLQALAGGAGSDLEIITKLLANGNLKTDV
jgi:hypothetical protein